MPEAHLEYRTLRIRAAFQTGELPPSMPFPIFQAWDTSSSHAASATMSNRPAPTSSRLIGRASRHDGHGATNRALPAGRSPSAAIRVAGFQCSRPRHQHGRNGTPPRRVDRRHCPSTRARRHRWCKRIRDTAHDSVATQSARRFARQHDALLEVLILRLRVAPQAEQFVITLDGDGQADFHVGQHVIWHDHQ